LRAQGREALPHPGESHQRGSTKQRIVVEHGDIPGLMPAMTMGYTLAVPKEAQSLALGDKISADLVVTDGLARLEKIVLLEKAKPVPMPAPAAKP
jgi:Cu/Ag efflux protein CusF